MKFSDLYLINTHNGIPSKNILPIDIKQYPSVKSHLDEYLTKIKDRDDQGITPYNLRSCAYMDDFSKHKIIYPDIMRMPRNPDLLSTYPYFYFDRNAFYAEATNFILTGSNIELIFTFLASKIGFYSFSKFYTGPQFDETGFRYKKEYMNNMIIPDISQSDNEVLTLCFDENYGLDNDKLDKVCEEIFIKTIGLDKKEEEIIHSYKKRLLLTNKI